VESGYAGGRTLEALDPTAGLTRQDLRAAMNATGRYQDWVAGPGGTGPGYQCPVMGWGIFERPQAEAAWSFLQGGAANPESLECVAYMDAVMEGRKAAFDCYRSGNPAC
jgi:hypothetical protein